MTIDDELRENEAKVLATLAAKHADRIGDEYVDPEERYTRVYESYFKLTSGADRQKSKRIFETVYTNYHRLLEEDY